MREKSKRGCVSERVVFLLTRLDYVEKGGAEGGLLGLQAVKEFTGEVFFQEGFGVRGFQFLETGFQFFQNGGVNHGRFSKSL